MRSIELRLERITYTWDGVRDVLRGLDGRYELRGVVALCGANGSGKSTLLALIAGEIAPTDGRVVVSASGIALPRQRLEARLSSPGEAQRRRLDALLREDPELLLLDEPTNHLDAQALRALEERLRRRTGPTLLVSHDRDLVDRLASSTLWLEDGALFATRGGFERAWAARQDRLSGALRAREERDAGIRQARDRLASLREDARGRARDRSTGSRMRDRNDSDARAIGADFRVRKAETRSGRSVALARSDLARLEASPAPEVKRDALRDVVFPWDPSRASRRLALPAGSVPTPGGSSIRHGGVVLDGRSRVRLAGGNGAGKSTLLSALAESAGEGVFHLPQEPSADDDRDLVLRMRASDRGAFGRFLSLAAALGASGESLRSTGAPSPGEARKLRLAQALASDSWMLLLDEPTNHMDAPSIQRLQEALRRWPGGLVLCTHDERLAAAATSASWTLEGGRLAQ